MNFALFRDAPLGTAVRLGGRFASPGSFVASDSGTLSVLPHEGLDLSKDELAAAAFVEIVGTKEADGVLRVAEALPFKEAADGELWDEAVKLSQTPALRHLFVPQGDVIMQA